MATKKVSTEESASVAAKINPALDALARPISTLRLDERNARKHERRSVDAIKTSLSTYGQQKPIVALTTGVVIAGNGTLEAARELGWDRIAVVTFDNEDEARARAFAIMDNRSTELSSWDDEMLREALVQTDIDGLLSVTGFTLDQLSKMTAEAALDLDPGSIGADPESVKPSREEIEGMTTRIHAVPLLLDKDYHPRFNAIAKALAKAYDVETITDAIVGAVEEIVRIKEIEIVVEEKKK